MNSLVSFATALSDPLRLRILCLLKEHKVEFGVLREILAVSENDLARHVKLLIDSGLLKATKTGTQAKIKHKHASLLDKIFTHFKISPKTEAQLGEDRNKLLQIQDKKRLKTGTKVAAKRAAKRK